MARTEQLFARQQPSPDSLRKGKGKAKLGWVLHKPMHTWAFSWCFTWVSIVHNTCWWSCPSRVVFFSSYIVWGTLIAL